MRKIQSHHLISQKSVDFTRWLFEQDGVMNVYVHTYSSDLQVGGGEFGSQTISTKAIGHSDQKFIKSFFF